jgi:hypothetical protein
VASALARLLRPSAPTHSRFGGLWIDRADAHAELAARRARGAVSDALAEAVAHFMDNGYVIFQGGVPAELVDLLSARIARAYVEGDARLRYHTDGKVNHVLAPGTDPRGKRIIESHAVLEEVRDALSAPRILDFVEAVFDEQPVLTQSLIFQNGSEQPLHQDPVFVTYTKPLHMTAAWIALEDVRAGSGELQYVPGSHRLPDYVFASGRLDQNNGRPGELDGYNAWLAEQIAARGLARTTFLPKKGDVLLWHAGLAHGGAPITHPGATRQSLVGHFCPRSVRPRSTRPRPRRQHGRMLWSNHLYKLGFFF